MIGSPPLLISGPEFFSSLKVSWLARLLVPWIQSVPWIGNIHCPYPPWAFREKVTLEWNFFTAALWCGREEVFLFPYQVSISQSETPSYQEHFWIPHNLHDFSFCCISSRHLNDFASAASSAGTLGTILSSLSAVSPGRHFGTIFLPLRYSQAALARFLSSAVLSSRQPWKRSCLAYLQRQLESPFSPAVSQARHFWTKFFLCCHLLSRHLHDFPSAVSFTQGICMIFSLYCILQAVHLEWILSLCCIAGKRHLNDLFVLAISQQAPSAMILFLVHLRGIWQIFPLLYSSAGTCHGMIIFLWRIFSRHCMESLSYVVSSAAFCMILSLVLASPGMALERIFRVPLPLSSAGHLHDSCNFKARCWAPLIVRHSLIDRVYDVMPWEFCGACFFLDQKKKKPTKMVMWLVAPVDTLRSCQIGYINIY